LALALVRDLRDHRAPVSEEDLADFETDVPVSSRRSPPGCPGCTSSNADALDVIARCGSASAWRSAPLDRVLAHLSLPPAGQPPGQRV